MQLPEKSSLTFKNTNKDLPRGTALITGMPRCGKTALSVRWAESMVGPGETFFIDLPEEEGTGSLGDLDIPYVTLTSGNQLDELYKHLLNTIKPKGLILDGLGSFYWMLMKDKVPSGIPPEDHGKTWMMIANFTRREITRFKMIPSVEWFIATSLVWPDTDEITGQKGRVQVVLPGQLKSNIYGLFSYNTNITIEDGPKGSTRILELQPTARTVAGIRAPMSMKVPSRVGYDLADEEGFKPIAKALGLKLWQKEEVKSASSN